MDCLFCKIAAKQIPAQIIFEDADLMVFHDIKPQAPLHALIIPKRHIATINDASEADALLLGRMVLRAKAVAAQTQCNHEGYRLVFNVNSGGGQEVYHIHLHLLAKRQMTWPPG